jgi:hypothetical protein
MNTDIFAHLADDVPAIGRPELKTLFVEDCPKCAGSGTYHGYSRYGVQCFACKGSGRLEFTTSKEQRQKSREAVARRKAKAEETKAEKAAAWLKDHPAEAAWMQESAERFEFARSMLEAVNKWGALTERQLETVQRLVAQSAERKAKWAEERAARDQAAPAVSVEAIEVAFGKAKQAGIRRPKLRLDSFTFSPASADGKNAGALYVKEGETYLGKIAGGKLFASRDCSSENQERILAVAADPEQAAVAYGKRFGQCSVCARELTNEDSINRGIGPICAERFGW